MELTIQCENISQLEPDWSRLLEGMCQPYPFASPAWIQTWWNEFKPEGSLCPLSLRQDGRLLGVAPLMRRGDGLSLAGDPNICDYMDLVTHCDNRAAVLKGLLTHLARAESWRVLEFWGLAQSSPTLALLPEVAAELGYRVTTKLEATCPGVDLPSTWDDYLANLSKKDRHELRRKLRRVTEAGETRFYCLTDTADVARGMDDFLSMHRGSRQDKAEFMTATMESFFRRSTLILADKGLIRLYFLEVGGKRVASVICFAINNDLWLYNSGYDPQYSHLSVGLVSKALCVQDAITQGMRRVDFLRGNERYKYELGAVDRPVYDCVITRV